jgi:hypothetical protein
MIAKKIPANDPNTFFRPGCFWVVGLLLIIGLIAPFHAVGATCFAPPTGLVGWWPGEGNANDIIGTNNGSLQGGATANAVGMVNAAFNFDGTNGYVQIPDSAVLKPTNLTVEAWVRFASLDSAGTSPAGQQYIVFKQNTRSGAFEGINLSKDRKSGIDVFIFGVTSASGQAAELQSAVSVTAGTWYHVAGVRGSNFIQLYVNGHLERQTNVSFPQDYGNLPLFFGTTGQPAWDHKLNGSLDEVSLFNRALSSNEITAIYTAGAAGKCRVANITAQPQSQTVAVGANVNFSVTANGPGPLNYQWQRSGTNLVDVGNISGSSSSALALANVQTGDAANYQVFITNTAGVTGSAVAVLNVDPALTPPSITTQPTNQTVVATTNVTLTVEAAGSGPLSYQWLLNGTNLSNNGQFSGVTSPTLLIPYALPSQSGGYSVVVTNFAGSVTSAVATVTVNLQTDCLQAPAGLIGWWPGEGNAKDIVGTNNGILQGGALANVPGFTGSAFGFDGTNAFVQIPNAPELNPTNLTIECWVKFNLMDTPGNSTIGAQYLVFKQNSRSANFEGFNLSKHRYTNSDIIVWEASSATGQASELRSATVVASNVWYHVVGVRGSNYLQLYMNGQLEAQATVNYPQDYGNYPMYFGTSNESYWDHKLSGTLDEVALFNRALSPGEIASLYLAGTAGKCKAPTIVTQPQGGVRYWGSSMTFTSTATGLNPLACQWQKNGLPVIGATNTSLVLTNVQATNAGNYTMVVTNLYGSAVSQPALLGVKLADVALARSAVGDPGAVGLTISGLANQIYGVQYSSNLGQSDSWLGLTNLTLSTSTNVWFDPLPPTQPQRYYRVVPGPISVP